MADLLLTQELWGVDRFSWHLIRLWLSSNILITLRNSKSSFIHTTATCTFVMELVIWIIRILFLGRKLCKHTSSSIALTAIHLQILFMWYAVSCFFFCSIFFKVMLCLKFLYSKNVLLKSLCLVFYNFLLDGCHDFEISCHCLSKHFDVIFIMH